MNYFKYFPQALYRFGDETNPDLFRNLTIYTEILDETHIRGSKTITNITEFMYVMQPISLNDSLFQFIRILKHRGQSVKNKFFKLSYNKIAKTIDHDRISDFADFKEVFSQRNRL